MRRPLSAQNSFIRRMTVPSGSALSQDAVWNLFNTSGETTPDTRRWYPFAFTPGTIPGFAEYKATYSHFRILKAKLYISRNVLNVEGVPTTILLWVADLSRLSLTGGATAYPYAYVPPQKEDALRQSRWQKDLLPQHGAQCGHNRFPSIHCD